MSSQIKKPRSSPPRVRRSFIAQVVFQTAFTFLTSGVFLSGLAIYMGAGDTLVSYISMIANICGISILFFSSFMERFRSFKKITILLTLLSRLVTLLIVLIPLLASGRAQLAAFVPLMVLAFTLQAQTLVVLNNWMVNFVDGENSGRYIARRQTFALGITVLLSLAGGRLLDAVDGAYIGFILLFSAAFFMSALELIVLLRIPDALRKGSAGIKSRFADMIRVPVKSRPFRRFVAYIFLFYLFLSIADSFTVVYMMRYLKLSYIATTAMQMLISLPQIFLLGIWGRISDKKGHRFSLKASVWFFVGETFFVLLSNSHNLFAMLPIAFLFSAVGNAGFVVSVFNRRYELMPKEGRILYDNFYSAAVGLAFILGPVIGGTIKRLLESSAWIRTNLEFGNIRLLYGLSAAAIILLQIVFFTSQRQKNHAISKEDS